MNQRDKTRTILVGTRPVSTRVREADAVALERLASRHDRSLSREVGRAIRFYLAHPDAATVATAVTEDARGDD
jgi:hypothetical protein